MSITRKVAFPVTAPCAWQVTDDPLYEGGGGEAGLPLSKLAAYWPLDEASGRRYDWAGNLRHLAEVNSVGTSASGPFGVAAQFVRANAEKLTLSSDLGPTNPTDQPVTVSLWFRAANNSQNQILFSLDNLTVRHKLDKSATGLTVHLNGAVKHDVASGVYSVGTWHHYVWTYDQTTSSIYVDGNLIDSQPVAGPITSGSEFWVGARDASNQLHFDGDMCEMSAWSVALTAKEVEQLTNLGDLGQRLPVAWEWSPQDLDGLALWLDASDSSTITEAAGKVSQWNDKSGLGNHATQATGSIQPSTGTRTINGLNVLDSDGGDWMTLGKGRIGGTGLFADPGERFMVLAVAVHDGKGTVVGRASGLNTNWSFALGLSGSEDLFVYSRGVKSSAPHSFGSETIYSATWDGTAGAYSFNGAGAAVTVGTAAENTGEDIQIFTRTSGGYTINGAIAEVIITDTYDAAGLAAAKQYLGQKWGVSL